MSEERCGSNELNENEDVTEISSFAPPEPEPEREPEPQPKPEPEPQPKLDLDLRLAVAGHDNNNTFSDPTARSLSLADRLAMNEQAPPPPRDFLSLRPYSPPMSPMLQNRHLQVALDRQFLHNSQRRLVLPSAQPALQPIPHHHQNQLVAAQPAQPVWNHRASQLIMPWGQQPAPTTHHLIQPQLLALPPLQQQPNWAVQGRSPASIPNMTAAFSSPVSNSGLYRALNALANSQNAQSSSGSVNIMAGGPSNPNVSAPINVANPLAPNNRGKHPLIAGESDQQAEPAAKRARLMQETRPEDNSRNLMIRETPGSAQRQPAGPQEKTEGFLYQCRGGQVGVICNCHGTFLTPAEFVEHAGGVNSDGPMRHILVFTNTVPNPEKN